MRLLVSSVIGLLASRFILQALGASDFGLYNVVGGIVFIIAFLNTVMISTTYRFIAFELGAGQDERVNGVFNISFVIHTGLALLIVFLAETIGVYYIRHYLVVDAGKLDDAIFVFRFAILGTVTSIISVPFQGLITAKEKFVVTALSEILKSSLYLAIVIYLLYFPGNRLRLYAVLMAFITMLPPLIYYLYTRRNYPEIIKWNFQRGRSKYREMALYSVWIMFGAAASIGEVQGSNLIINLFFGTVVNASFGIANQVNNVVKTFAETINQAAVPQITKSYSGGKTDRTMELVIFSSKYSFFLMLIPAVPILLETDYILKIWLKDVPQYTGIFIQLMIANALISTMNAGIPAAVHATGKIKYFQIILSSLRIMGLPIAYFMLKRGDPPYVLLLVYTTITIIALLIRQILLKRLIQFDVKEFFYRAYLKMILVALVMVPFFFVRDVFASNIWRFFGLSLVSVLWLLAMIYLLGMEREEKRGIAGYIRTFIDRYVRRKFVS
jgi:O-antigen/teichoic acid export membrane protein